MSLFQIIYDIFFKICHHEYETIHKIKLTTDGRPTGTNYVSKCKKCGKIKYKKITND